MSAGICIMNKTAIALAADSAVTIGAHLAIHNSANKLFSLSRIAPIGVIVYANAELMGVPIETIVKQHKNDLSTKTFPQLKDYVENFLSYLINNATLFRFPINEDAYVTAVYTDLLHGLFGDYQRMIKTKIDSVQRELTEEELLQIQTDATTATCRFVDGMENIENFDETEYISTVYGKRIDEHISTNYSWVPIEIRSCLREAVIAVYKKKFFRSGYVGIAFAGYGKSEIFGRMVHIHLSGIINGHIRYYTKEVVEINEAQTAKITPLAQTDVMQTFLFGINDNFISDLSKEIPMQIKSCFDNLDDSFFVAGKKEEVPNSLNSATSRIISQVISTAQSRYLFPITSSVATLPIEELSLLAESMINITSLRRKVAIDDNNGTVGGPIDVAIISKSDGFIWLKRKHYFDQKYNPQYFYSHYLSGKEDTHEQNLDSGF